MEDCSTRICKALQIRNMKQIDLSMKTGIPKSAISQYCSGAFKPKQKRLFLIAHALNVDEAWLMGLDVPMDRNTDESVSVPACNIIRIAARDGSFVERELTDQQLAALQAILDQLPDVPEGL